MLMFFPVSAVSFHAVEEVIKGVRISISGWFYAKDSKNHPYTLPKNVHIHISPSIATTCEITNSIEPEKLDVNPFYSSSSVLVSVSKVLRNEHVVSLTSFFSSSSFGSFCFDKNTFSSDQWKLMGPPNHRLFYENSFESSLLSFFQKSPFINSILSLFYADRIFYLSSAKIQKFLPGSYMVIHDDFPSGCDQSVDVLFFSSPQSNDENKVSKIHYTCLRKKKKSKQEEVLDIDPYSTNSLYLVSVQKDTQISVDYLNSGSIPFYLFFLRFSTKV